MTASNQTASMRASTHKTSTGRRPGDPPRPYPEDPDSSVRSTRVISGPEAAHVVAQAANDHAASDSAVSETLSPVVQDRYTGPAAGHVQDLLEAIGDNEGERAARSAMEIIANAWPTRAEARGSVIIQIGMATVSFIQGLSKFAWDEAGEAMFANRITTVITLGVGTVAVVILNLVS